MTKTSIKLQELSKRIYEKAKAEKQHRFWGLYVHVCKLETLTEAYKLSKANNGAPGIDGMTFEQIEQSGVERFIMEIQEALKSETYRSCPNRKVQIPKGNGKFRTLGISTIRDRVVQGALKLILEPIFEADFQDGSYGYRPRRSQHPAVNRVEQAMVRGMTRVIDVDLSAYFDSIRHHILLAKVAERVKDDQVMHLLKIMLKAGGKVGVPQGSLCKALHNDPYAKKVIMQSK